MPQNVCMQMYHNFNTHHRCANHFSMNDKRSVLISYFSQFNKNQSDFLSLNINFHDLGNQSYYNVLITADN